MTKNISENIIDKICESKYIPHALLIESNKFELENFNVLKLLKKCLGECRMACSCSSCNKIESFDHPELKIIEAEGQFLKKEQILELQQEFSKKPLFSMRKVYVIKNAEKLNQSSANTLLKFLEEPNENIIAILHTTNVYNVIETIKSRCQIIRMEKEYNEVEEEISEIIDFFVAFEKDKKNLLVFQNKYKTFLENRDNFENFLDKSLIIFRELIYFKLGNPLNYLKDYEEQATFIKEKNDFMDFVFKLRTLTSTKRKLLFNPNAALSFHQLLIELGGEYNG